MTAPTGLFGLMPLCLVMEVKCTQGMHSTNTFILPLENVVGPIKTPETTPPSEPASSPLDIGICDFKVTTGMAVIKTLMDVLTANVGCERFG